MSGISFKFPFQNISKKVLNYAYMYSLTQVSSDKTWAIDTTYGYDNKVIGCAFGYTFASAIDTDGRLWTWGRGTAGRLGNGLTISQSSPVQTISGGTNWKLTSGSAGIKTDGTLWNWGPGNAGGLGNNLALNMSSPVQTISGGTNWKSISVENINQRSVATKTDGTLWLWGNGSFGVHGNLSAINRSSPVQTVSGGTDWKNACLSSGTVTAVKTDGTLWNWGLGLNGELGNNARLSRSSPVQTISGGNNWNKVGRISSIKTDGTLWVWGAGLNGGLGNGNTLNQSSPVQTVVGGTNWRSINKDGCQTIAIKTDNTLWAWGEKLYVISDGRSELSVSPIQVLNNCSWKHSDGRFLIDSNNKLFSFGCNAYGYLGINKAPISYSVDYATCVRADVDDVFVRKDLFTDSGLWIFGCDPNGALGNNGDRIVSHSSPIQTVSGGSNWKKLSAGNSLSSAIKTDGTLWTWGEAFAGKLGNDRSSPNLSSPVQTASGGTNWKDVSSNFNGSIAIKTDGSLWLWGCGGSGLLGNVSSINHSSPIQTIAGGTNWRNVITGYGTAVLGAIKTDGTLWLWGFNQGRLGNNAVPSESSPVQTISSGTNWKLVTSSSCHTASIKTDGTLWVWGAGQSGSLGNNNTIRISSPIQTISGGTNWKNISGGFEFSISLKTDGTLWTWGLGERGVLGNNNTINISSPIQTISGGTNWSCVSSGRCNGIGIKTDGTLWMWGSNERGHLNINASITAVSSPVQTLTGGNNWRQACGGLFHILTFREDCW